MSRKDRSGVIPSIGLNTSSGKPPMPPHKIVHITVEKSPTRPETLRGRNAEYSGYGKRGIPPSSRASTPGPCGYSNQYETFGSNHHYNLSWMLDERNAQMMSSGPKRGHQDDGGSPTSISSPSPDTTPPSASPLLEKEHSRRNQSTQKSQRNRKKRQDFLMQWFDRCVDKELNNRKKTCFGVLLQDDPSATNVDKISEFNLSSGTLESMGGASARQMEEMEDLRTQPDSIS